MKIFIIYSSVLGLNNHVDGKMYFEYLEIIQIPVSYVNLFANIMYSNILRRNFRKSHVVFMQPFLKVVRSIAILIILEISIELYLEKIFFSY